MTDTPVVPEPVVAEPVAPKKAAKPKKTVKAMTKSQVAGYLAEKVGITKKQSVQYMEELVKLAIKEAKNGFTFSGLGKLVLVKTKARTVRVPFGEHAGEMRKVPAKKVLRFRVAKAAKEAVK